MRVFAGPNGSGKSTVINTVRTKEVDGQPIDFGFYINADDIAMSLREGGLAFDQFEVAVAPTEFREMALASGLINGEYPEPDFLGAYRLRSNKITLRKGASDERLAQVIADFLRKKLLTERKRFSFETVFSHRSKLEIMRQAAEAGYKVYLYFVSTISPEINKFRVEARVKQGGHPVPPEKIVSRYERSMDLLYDACQIAYQVYFFDNSEDGRDSVLFAHFKKAGEEKQWDELNEKEVPVWFKQYYSAKIPR